MTEVRTLIRQILLEELGKHDGIVLQDRIPAAVSIRNSDDLNSFALQVLDIAEGSDLKADMQSGKVKFTLLADDRLDNNPVEVQQPSTGNVVPFLKGVITEKDIARLADGTTSISVGKTVCFTPLAMDEIRRKGLNIERISQ